MEVKMPHVITEPCLSADHEPVCVGVCPTDSIHPRADEADYETAEQLYIDPSTCIDCGVCIDECPVKAIFAEADVPAEWQKYIEINANHFK